MMWGSILWTKMNTVMNRGMNYVNLGISAMKMIERMTPEEREKVLDETTYRPPLALDSVCFFCSKKKMHCSCRESNDRHYDE